MLEVVIPAKGEIQKSLRCLDPAFAGVTKRGVNRVVGQLPGRQTENGGIAFGRTV